MDIQLKRGMLDVCVLAAIKDEDSYGYQIIKDMKPYVTISESTLYPILRRLEAGALLTVHSVEHNGRLRKYYHITDAGRARIEELQEYLESIRSRISAMPADDVNRFMDYYSEMIDDRVEDGLSEEEAVADMGSPDAAVEQILEDMPLTKLVKEKIKPKHELKAWEVVLIVLGSPVWIPLLITAAVLLLTLWIVAFALLISFYAVVLSFVVAGIGGLICTIPLFVAHSPYTAVLMLGAALIGVGIAILFVVSVKPVTVGI